DPGTQPGGVAIITAEGNLSMNSSSTFVADLISTGSFDRIAVTGTVDLGSSTLSVVPHFTPSPGDTFNIVSNDGGSAVTGTFNGLPEGASFSAGGFTFGITYVGGSGNDVNLVAGGIVTPSPTLTGTLTPTPTNTPTFTPSNTFTSTPSSTPS